MSDRAKRLFIGFPIPITQSLRAAVKRTRIGAQKKEMEVEWAPEANYHITVNFLGTTALERLPLLEEIIESVVHSSSQIETSLKGMGAFPDERHMRVLWVGIRKSRALAELQETLRTRLVEADFPQEDREYSPHLTIGRLRKSRSGTDLISPYVRTAFGETNLSELVLYESVLHGARPFYSPLKTFQLPEKRSEE